jgi:hypothetical protein
MSVDWAQDGDQRPAAGAIAEDASLSVGVMVAPDIRAAVAEQLCDELREALARRARGKISWEISLTRDASRRRSPATRCWRPHVNASNAKARI